MVLKTQTGVAKQIITGIQLNNGEPFNIVRPVEVLRFQSDDNSVKSIGYPRNKPQNGYRLYRRSFAEGGAFGIKPYTSGNYYYAQHLASVFSAVNPTAALLGNPGNHLVPEDEVLRKLRSRVKDVKINMPVFLAESKKTAQMILGTAKRLARALSQVRQRDLRGAASTLGCRPLKDKGGGSANNWLEYKYGWLPLLSDAYGAGEHLARRVISTKFEQRVQVALTRTTTINGFGSVNGTVQFPQHINAEYVVEVKSSSFASVNFICTNDTLREAAQLGFTDPLLVAWEVVPLSFVVDWFIPIGNFIEQFNAFSGLKVEKCFVNQRTTELLRGKGILPGYGTWREKNFTFGRSIYPDPSVQFPSFKMPDNQVVQKLITSLALFRQRI